MAVYGHKRKICWIFVNARLLLHERFRLDVISNDMPEVYETT